MITFPSSESASKSSGGRRSFSISDFRLFDYIHEHHWIKKNLCRRVGTYASSKPVMASLIPSEPSASVPYGNLAEPDTLLSSETFSDSSL